MKVYIAITNRKTHTNGWYGCLSWAQEAVNIEPSLVVKIHVARPAVKKMRIVAEVSIDGIRLIRNGRQVSTKAVGTRHG